MPIYADPAHGPAVRLVADDDLTMLATFLAEPPERPGDPPHAADLEPVAGTDPYRLAEVLARDLPGVLVTTTPLVADALVASGGQEMNVMVLLDWDLADHLPHPQWAAPDLGPGLRLVALAELDVDYDSLWGEVLDDPSGAVLDDEGRELARVVVVRAGPNALVRRIHQHGGPPGLAQALLERALTVSSLAGTPRLGLELEVSDPAVESLRAMGFAAAGRRRTILLPRR